MASEEDNPGGPRPGADETGHTPQDYMNHIQALQEEIFQIKVNRVSELAAQRPERPAAEPNDSQVVWGNWNPTALPKYDGTLTVDLLARQDAIETFMQLKRVPKSHWGTFVKFAISKDVLTWYYNLRRENGNQDPTWDSVTTEFQNRALSRVCVNDIRNRIQLLIFHGDITKYIEEYNELSVNSAE